MGSIIREDTEGDPSAALTETGKGGLLSQGYLRDAPAREYVGEGERPVFVLLDEVGVERVQDGDRTAIVPGKGYRSITVVTDRRLIVLVGNAGDGGDKRVTLPLVEVFDAHAADGDLVVEMGSAVTWCCHVGASGLEEVAAYVDAAAAAWRAVESHLDAIKRALVDATDHRDAGEYEAALDAMREARDDVAAVEERTAAFTEEWPGEAMETRVEKVRDRCLRTAAEIRVGYARATIDDGEEYWRAGKYEQAREAFEDALEAFEAVRSLASRHRSGIDDVEEAIARLERSMQRLDDAPLRNAIDADQRAREIEPSLDALDALEKARERYERVLELDPADGERRFAGDRDRIREQREEVTDRFVETALEVGTDALEAGQWYCETGQTEYAEEELECAIEALDRGIAVAETERPTHAEDLRRKRTAARERLDALHEEEQAVAETEEATDPEGVAETEEKKTEPAANVAKEVNDTPQPTVDVPEDAVGEPEVNILDDPSNRVGGVDATADETTAGDATAADGGIIPATAAIDDALLDASEADSDTGSTTDPRESIDVESELRNLPPVQFEQVVTAVVEAMGWRPESTASAACDFLAEQDGAAGRTLAIRAFPNENNDPIDADAMAEAADLASSVPTADAVMAATTRPLTDGAIEAARTHRVRLVDTAYLADVLGAGDGDIDSLE